MAEAKFAAPSSAHQRAPNHPRTFTLWFSLLDHDGGVLGEMRAELPGNKTTVFDLCLAIKRMCPETVLCDPFRLKVCDTNTNTILESRVDLAGLNEPTIEVLVPKSNHGDGMSDIVSQLGDAAGSQVVWVSDAERPACVQCKRKRCGEVFCKDCSAKRVLINSQRSRVCDECFTAVSAPRKDSQSMSNEESDNDELELQASAHADGGMLEMGAPVHDPRQDDAGEAGAKEEGEGEEVAGDDRAAGAVVAALTPQVSREEVVKGLTGSWTLENRDGDLDDFMDKLGVPWLTRKVANSAPSFTMIASFEGTDVFVVKMRSAVRNIDKPRMILDGRTVVLDVNAGTGDKMEVVASWQADGSIVLEKKNLKDQGRNLREVRRFVDGKHVVEMTLVHKGVSYVDTYVRV